LPAKWRKHPSEFLLDHDVPEDLSYLLAELGHEVVLLRKILPEDAADDIVLRFAYDHDCLLITCNRDDFIRLAAVNEHHGIIVAVRRRTRAAERGFGSGCCNGPAKPGLRIM
jgi:predicted nuclease of predicted toxin-antitoxin system